MVRAARAFPRDRRTPLRYRAPPHPLLPPPATWQVDVLPVECTLGVWDALLSESIQREPDAGSPAAHEGGGTPVAHLAATAHPASGSPARRDEATGACAGGAGTAHLRAAVALFCTIEPALSEELRQPSSSAHADPTAFYSVVMRAVEDVADPMWLERALEGVEVAPERVATLRREVGAARCAASS